MSLAKAACGCVGPIPKGDKALEWFLLTNHPVTTLKDACLVIKWYEARWVIEEFHKAMKTGYRIEELQFNYLDRLEPMIAVLSTVAVTLLNLRAVCRTPDAKTRRATSLFSPDYVRVLAAWRFKKSRTDLTIREFGLALARLGGHQNRKHDGLPGWITLWRGWSKLQAMLEGAEIALPTGGSGGAPPNELQRRYGVHRPELTSCQNNSF